MPKPKRSPFKQLVSNFDTQKPDFTALLPYLTKQQEVDLQEFTATLVGKWSAIQSLWQLSLPDKPKARSRVWSSSDGYKFLVQWSNAVVLRILGEKLLAYLKSSNSPLTSTKGWKFIDRLKAQFLDELRSVIANIEEGYARPTTGEYLQFLGYSQGSLKEAKGDIERMLQDNYLKSIKNSAVMDICLVLKNWNHWAKDPANTSHLLSFPLEKNTGGYRNLKDVRGQSLTYEMFIELINKTDYLLRKLVESLEQKLAHDNLSYTVEQARIKQSLRK